MVAVFETMAAKRASRKRRFFLMMAPLQFVSQRATMEDTYHNGGHGGWRRMRADTSSGGAQRRPPECGTPFPRRVRSLEATGWTELFDEASPTHRHVAGTK